jgi:hypothetical protein
MPKYLSGRIKKKDQNKVALTTTRYQHFSLDETEPNLGNPLSGTFQDTPPAGARYQIVSVDGRPGERYWVPVEGGIIPGTITIYDEGNLVGGINSTSQINFTGLAVTATSNGTFTEVKLDIQDDAASKDFNIGVGVTQKDNDAFGYVKNSETIIGVGIVTLTNVTGTFSPSDGQLYLGASSPGGQGVGAGKTPTSVTPSIIANVAVAVTISPQYFSTNEQVTFNDNGEFNGAGGLVYRKNGAGDDTSVGLASVGIGTTNPYRTLHIGGDLKLDGTIYDNDNEPGAQNNILTKGTDGVIWQRQEAVITGAGGTIGQVQYHNDAGTVGGASNFYFDADNDRVGIGSTIPTKLLDVLGDSIFTGDVTFDGNTAGYDALWDRSENSFIVKDNAKFAAGDDGDLQIRHLSNTNDSYIENNKGDLWIQNNNDGYDNGSIYIQAEDGDHSIVCHPRSGVYLYYTEYGGAGDVLKAETTVNGFKVSGLLEVTSGTSDFQGDVRFNGVTSGRDIYFDESQNSLYVLNNAELRIGSTADLQIYHDDSTLKTYVGLYSGGGKTLDFVSFDNNLGVSTAMRVTQVNSGDDYNTYVNLYYNGVEKLEVTENGINITGHVETDTLNVSAASTISNIKIGGLGGNLPNTIDTSSGNLIINANAGSNTIITDSELQIDSTEQTTGNDDGALIVAGGVHIKRDLLVCNDPETIDTIDPVKVGIATITPVDRLQIGSQNEFIPVVNTTTGDLAAPVGDLGTNEITGITISGSGIVIGQEVKSGFHTVGTKISNIVGNTITVDTYATNTGTETDVPITFGIRNDSAVIAIGQTGFVGIGTTSAEAKLDVRGNLQVTGIASVSETVKVGASVTISSSGDTFISGITSVGTGVTITPSNGGIAVTGIITATGGFIGTIRSSDIEGDISATNITVAEESTDETCNVVFVTSSTGTLPPKTNANLTYKSSSGELYSSSFKGNGSLLTGVIGVGTGVEIQNNGTSVGAAATINFGRGLDIILSTNTGIATVNAVELSEGSGSGSVPFADYASHSETANYAYGIAGIEITSYNNVGILTGSQILPTDSARFGESVATSADGNTIIVAAKDHKFDDSSDRIGGVYVYDRVGTTFTEVGILTGSYSSSYDDFGSSIACSADGNTITVGAISDEFPGSGSASGLVYVFDREGNDFTEVGILTGSHADDANDKFGFSVECSADGNTIIVGAINDEYGSSGHTGAVYVFDREYSVGIGTTFNQVGFLTGSDSGSNDQFGHSVACGADGNIIVVGAHDAEESGSGSGSGKVYVFDREYSVGIGTNFNQVGILTGSYADSTNDGFGYSVATSVDGNTVIVGAWKDKLPGYATRTGLVYVFDREYSVGIGTNFNQVGILTGSYMNIEDGFFGISVDCSADGNNIVVGAIGNTAGNPVYSGLTYAFNRQGNNFNEVGIFTGNTNNEYDSFGYDVACSADGKHIIVGTQFYHDETEEVGYVYVFDQDVDANSLLSSTDGKNITIESNLIVKGDIKGTADNADRSIFSSFADYASHSETSNGSYNLVGIGSTYSQVGILTGSGVLTANFGASVATSSDGNIIVVGASKDTIGGAVNCGGVYVYDRVGTTFNEVGILTGSYASNTYDRFGQSVATSADGKTIIVGAYGDELPDHASSSGVVYVFDREGNNFNEVGILTGSYADDIDDFFGASVATSADGKTIVVGVSHDKHPDNLDDSGLVYVFDREGNDFNEVGILTGTHSAYFNDNFGQSVATSADGKTIIVGAWRDNLPGSADNSGLVYVFDREGNDFNEVGILTGSHADDENDYFGGEHGAVACSADGNTIIVGAYKDRINAGDGYGLVYVFDREYSVGIGTTFNQVGILTGSVTGNGNNFGEKLACSADGNIIFVGTPQGSATTFGNTGLVYVFNRQGNNFNEVGIFTGSYTSDQINDEFGSAVACSADGKHIIVGAYSDELPSSSNNCGLAYVFDQTTVARDAITATDTGVLITGDLNVTGDITAFYTSDERLKDNITPIDNPLSKIISISGNTFEWNKNSNKSGHDVGVIAQEIKEILPEAVVERDNGYLAVDYYKVIPLLIESIKKLSEEKNIITSENDIKYRLIVDDDGNLSTEKV